MSISLKAELETWAAALDAYDQQDFDKALQLFSRIADSSKILTNMGLIYATVGEHESAVAHFVAATNLDSYLAIAYFQCGVSNFLLERYDIALTNFEDAFLFLRGNEAINYAQLGLKFKLFSAEILFNKGLSQIYLGCAERGLADMEEARKQKVTNEHGVIDDAIRDRGDGYTVFSIPVGVLYRPSENKLKNSKTKDYLGKARLVAASDSNDAFTEFTGVKKLQQASGDILNNKNDQNKSDAQLSAALRRSASVPSPRPDPPPAHPTALERSQTTLPLGAGAVRTNANPIFASRRTQSVSSPTDAPPPPPPLPSDFSRSNNALGRSITSVGRLVRGATTSPGVASLSVKAPHGDAGGVADGSRADGDTGASAGGVRTAQKSQPSHRKLPQQPLPPPPPASLQLGQYMNTAQGAAALLLPAAPPPGQGEVHLSQLYDSYMEAVTDDITSRSSIPRPPTAQAQWSPPASQQSRMQSPSSSYQQPHPQPQEQQLPAWMQSAPSSDVTSSNTSMSSGTSRAHSRAASAGMINANPNMGMGMGGANMGMGGISNAGGGALRRKVTRRPTKRRVTTYDDDDGDDGFMTGEYEEFEMATIRVKLHYQDDVRGMTIPLTTSFVEFVERVTAKFGTPLMGLGMRFIDEDGTKISLRDESDFEHAIETVRENARGRGEGKLEVWCVDV